MNRFVIRGVVREAETGVGIPGLFVKAYDEDLLFDDLLGNALTGPDGSFEIVAEAEDFREFFDRRPDLYLRVYAADRETELWSSEDAVRWNAGRYEEFDVRIPGDRLGDARPAHEVRLVGDDDEPRDAFAAGESLTLHVQGLRPSTPHSVTVSDADGELFTDVLLTNGRGEIDPTVIWPLVGIEDPRGGDPLSVEEAREAWRDRELELTLRDGERVVSTTTVRVDAGLARPLVLASDGEGRVLSGFEVGEHPAQVTVHDPPEWESARVWMVPRQHDWRPGDPIRPVELPSGALAQADVELGGGPVTAVVAAADDVQPGAYDFVVRRVRYGYEDDDDLLLRPDDLVGGRRITGLVVREAFMPSKIIRGGCTNLQQIAARRTLGNIWPYVQFTDTFQVGEDVWGALDPLALDPAHTGKMVALYVVPHKTAAQWTADNSLSHLAVLGGNPAVQRWLTQSYCVNANLRLLWSHAMQPGAYDVVADFGNNTANAATFVPDDHYDMPLDIIDGYVVPGFRVVADPTVDTSFANAGAFMYDEATQGYVDVLDDYGFTTYHVPLKASVHFPADMPGATSAGQISAAQASYPLVVVVHGNYTLGPGSYTGYEYLLDHLARNGFIAASVHLEYNQTGTDRARVLRRHLQILFGLFGAHAANNVGIMGHSRGGEAVVIATRLNQQEAWGYNVNAVISLAPTNQYTFEHFGGAWARPFLVVYGSLDGDLGGIGDTGFELYDNASGMKKSMMFVYRSCHDRYNTVWGDWDVGQLAMTDQPRVLPVDAHHKIALGYMTAFFRRHLRNETEWEGLFKGEWVPAAVQASDPDMRIYAQYEDTTVRTVDDFEGAHTPTSWATSTIGGAVTQTGLPATPQEDDLRSIDSQSPHQTAGLVLRWDTLGDKLHYDVPAGQRDVHTFNAVSFRIGQRYGSASNPAGQPQDLRLTLTDGGGHSRAIRISKLTDVPFPDVRADGLTKSALRTVRVPLSVYAIKCFGVDQVDLTNVVSLEFEFSEKPTGEIEIDSVQFTN